MQFTHRDGRSATAATPTEAVTLRAMGFVQDAAEVPVEESPSADWSHERLDQYALSKNLDLSGAKTRADKVAAIEAGEKAAIEGNSDEGAAQ